MLETAIDDSSEEFGFQQEVAETCRVDTDVRTLLVGSLDTGGGRGGVGLLSSVSSGGGARGLLGIELLVIGVVDEILFARHVD